MRYKQKADNIMMKMSSAKITYILVLIYNKQINITIKKKTSYEWQPHLLYFAIYYLGEYLSMVFKSSCGCILGILHLFKTSLRKQL